ncbi:DNA-binding protein [Pediococcus inopinatus]|uniref:hypothetical protein n=1 Tax=Pediococcus TaxID=1253 RepID=UPI0007A02707|nr:MULTISPECIES: hypothetical protein [Pediococcus]MCT3031220.1 DNA-binding protein [Pediococcus parvulus]PIO80865.1 hypothetical protein BSQ38_03980 [Pediococcus damnosus]WPP09826.1 DNA-binding protein [Pediococcus inopinatus]
MEVKFELPQEAQDAMYKTMYDSAKDAFKAVAVQKELPEVMRLGEACTYLNCSRSTLSNFVREGLVVNQVGSLRRITKTNCDKFLKSHEVK